MRTPKKLRDALAATALAALLAPAAAGAQVGRVELDIAGYLCGF